MVKKPSPDKIREIIRDTLGEKLYSEIELVAFEKAELIIEAMRVYDENRARIKESSHLRDIIRMYVMDDYFEEVYSRVDFYKKLKMYDFQIAGDITRSIPTKEYLQELVKKQTNEAYVAARIS